MYQVGENPLKDVETDDAVLMFVNRYWNQVQM
jgi:hypothetical protein